MATKCELIVNGSIGSITVVAPTLDTNPHSPISNLFQTVTPKFAIHMHDPTLSQGEKVVAKVEPTVKVIVKYPETSVRSQCMYLKPLPATS